MRLLTFTDVRTRQRNLMVGGSSNPRQNVNINYLYESLHERYSFQNAKMVFEGWDRLADRDDTRLEKVLEAFDIVCDCDSLSNINYIANIIEGKIIPKVRGPKATRHLNNYKLGKFKIQNTKAQNHNKDNTNALKTALSNKGSVGNSLHPNRKYKYDIYGKKIDGTKKEKDIQASDEAKDKKIEECCDRFIEASMINDQCDRVLDNYNKISRRFDLDTKVRKTALTEEAIEECIHEMCSLIDGYDIPLGVKYNVALEEVMYIMYKNYIDVSLSTIAECTTDYFLLSRDCSDDMIHDMKYILENTSFYSKEDLENVYGVLESSKDPVIKSSEDEINAVLESSKKGNSNIKKLIQEFKLSRNKNVSTLKKCITRIFVNSPDNIVKNIPDIFDFLRITASIAVIGIQPVIGILTIITGAFLKMKIRRDEMERVIKQYKKSRDMYKKKAENAKNDKAKEQYNDMVKKLNDDIQKLEDYADNLYTEKEKEDRMAKKYMEDNDDDFDFNFDESCLVDIDLISKIAKLCENMNWGREDLNAVIKNNIRKASSQDIYDISESVCLCNGAFDSANYINILEDELLYQRSLTSLSKYEKIDTIKECIKMVDSIKHNDLFEDNDGADPIDLIYENTVYYNEVINDTIELLTHLEESGGISFSSKLKIAKENLKKTAKTLKDKERTLSNKIDVSVGVVQQSAKKALINDNREAIIKGSLIPSASKCIKAAITTGAAWLVSPALAVIGALGAIGISKKLQKKERQLILDDIEIELDMCERYIKLAEEKNDMKAIRNLMQTKRALQRQQQRLKYNMAVEFGEKVHKVKDTTTDSYDEQYILLPGVEVS